MNAVILASALFALGLYGVLTRRDLVAVLASIEVMLGGANVLLIAVATSYRFAAAVGRPASGAAAASAGLIVLVLAAAEAAVGLALLAALVRERRSRVDEIEELSG